MIALASGCATIAPLPGSDEVDVISKQQVGGDWGSKCERVKRIKASDEGKRLEVEGSNLTALEVKLRNKAYQAHATHVSVGSAYTEVNGWGAYSTPITILPGTAYRCQ
jgi:hypothetical protein